MEVAVDRLRDAIIAGDLALGQKLSEQRLADTLGISRSPVRDALAALQAEGLVNIVPKRGSFVFTPDDKEVDDICEHRCILEKAAIRKAIGSSHRALINGLSKAIDKMDAAAQKDDAFQFIKGDMEFHNAIIDNGGNRSIVATYKRTISPLMALRTHLFTIMNATVERSTEEHLAILTACRDKDIEAAERIIEIHAGHLLEAYRQAGEETALIEKSSA